MDIETETTLLTRAAVALETITRIHLLTNEQETARPDEKPDGDATAYLRLPTGQNVGPLNVKIRRQINKATIGQLLNQDQGTKHPTLVVTEYVTPQIAELLQAKYIPYIDTAGNAALNIGDVFVHIAGRKLPKEQRTNRTPTRAFKTAGLKLILTILNDKPLLNRPYRDIAEVTGVALGTITNVFADLEELNFLQTVGKHRRLLNHDELIHKWADAYIERTRKKLVVGRYTTNALGNWHTTNLENFDAFWGGEVAAMKITNYLQPETVTIYANPPAGRIKTELQLAKDPNGNIELLEAFWPLNANITKNDIAPALVVYADLLAIGDDRTIETAKLLIGDDRATDPAKLFYEKLITVYNR